jgi:hypothetical protein
MEILAVGKLLARNPLLEMEVGGEDFFARDVRPKLATYLYFIVALATVQGSGQKRSLRASTRRELSFGTNGVLIRRV